MKDERQTEKERRRQIKELILFGAFGDPEKSMVEYYALVHPKESVPYHDYKRELSNRLCEIRTVDITEIENELGQDIVPFELFLTPQYYGQQIAVIGQMVEMPYIHTTKNKKEMAFVTLVPLDVDPSYVEPRIDVIVWPDGYHKFSNLDPEPSNGDILVVIGERAYHEKKHQPQITVGKDDQIFVLAA